MAKRGKVSVKNVTDQSIVIEWIDQKKQRVIRTIQIDDSLTVTDSSEKNKLVGFIHRVGNSKVNINGSKKIVKQDYASDYGIKHSVDVIEYTGVDMISAQINL